VLVRDFVRSGSISIADGSLRHFGREGNNWPGIASTYSSATDATTYTLYFGPSDVNPSNNRYHRFGFPVRCLVYWLVSVKKYSIS